MLMLRWQIISDVQPHNCENIFSPARIFMKIMWTEKFSQIFFIIVRRCCDLTKSRLNRIINSRAWNVSPLQILVCWTFMLCYQFTIKNTCSEALKVSFDDYQMLCSTRNWNVGRERAWPINSNDTRGMKWCMSMKQ